MLFFGGEVADSRRLSITQLAPMSKLRLELRQSARRYLEEGPNLRPNIAMLLEHTAYHPHSSSVTVIDNPLRIRSW